MAQITLIIFHLSDLPNLRAIISRHQLLKPSEKQILADFAGALIIFHLLNLRHLRESLVPLPVILLLLRTRLTHTGLQVFNQIREIIVRLIQRIVVILDVGIVLIE